MDKYELVPVCEQDEAYQSVLVNLTKMYCCEWSQYLGMDVDEDGKYIFEYYLHNYWTKPDHKAFLLRCVTDADKPVWAGFALLDRDFILHADTDYCMAEFFVLPVHRRRGAGGIMARSLFDRFPGKWEVGRNPKNTPSVLFWDRVIARYTGENFEYVPSCPKHRFMDGTLGDVFFFNNSKNPEGSGANV